MPVVDDTVKTEKTQEPTAKPVPPASTVPAVSSDFKKHVEELVRVEEQLESLKELRKSLNDALLADVPREPGDHIIERDGYKVTVAIPEKWTWDKEELEQKFGDGELPDYVQRNLTINRKKFEALAPGEQATISGALTVGPGTPKIKVEAS